MHSAKIKKILIVEEETAASLYLKELIESWGISVLGPVKTGIEAISIIATEIPDLILMDIIIKGSINSIETVEKINSLYSIPVIYLAASTDKGNLERAAKTVFFGFLIKPIDEYQLYSSIETALSKSGADIEIRENEQKYKLLFEHMTEAFFYLASVRDLNDNINTIPGI